MGANEIREAVAEPLTRCPLCGSKRIQRAKITFILHNGRSVPGVEADTCTSCGEQFLDLNAARELDQRRGKG